jgi:hypothetical protein
MATLNGEPARTRMPHFNAGDKVQCTWAKNSNCMLVVGKTYTIQTSLTGQGGSSVSVEGIEGAFDCSRFALVKDKTAIKLTETRAIYLGKIAASDDWIRDCGRTFNCRTNKKMPETVYSWLAENGLVDCDCGNLNATPKGKEALAAFYRMAPKGGA